MVRHHQGVVLIDTGMKSDGRDVLAGLDYFKATPGDIVAILLTHWHNDHSAGASQMQRASGAAVYYHASEAPYFTGDVGTRGLRAWLSERIPEIGMLVLLKGLLGESAPHPIRASHFVSDGEILLSDFVVIDTPGHTPGHVSYYYTPAKALFAGDALAVIDGELRFMSRPVTIDQAVARNSMKKCLALDLELICPGHREPLIDRVGDRTGRMLESLEESDEWPLLG
jgi:glyoxylase-like metal-dependent hydrolase (beta-lactamase superfamily II)